MDKVLLDPALKSHFLNLYSIALSDLEIDTTELELLYKFGELRGITKEEINNIIISPDKIKFSIPESLEEKIEYLYEFAKMIWADGVVHNYERNALQRFCKNFGFVEENIEEISEFLLEEANKGTSNKDLIKLISNNL